MTNTKPKRKLRALDYVIVVLGAALMCVVTNVFIAGLISIPIHFIHRLTHGQP